MRTRNARGVAVVAAAVAFALACDVGAPPGGEGQEAGSVAQDAGPRPPADRAWVIFGADTVTAEVARSAEERSQGLMYREDLPEGTGMLFVFPDEASRGFWMANTYIPLDIAYIDSTLRIVDIQQMEPEVTDTYDSAAPAMFALEVPQGWFEARGIGVGDVAEIVFGVQR
ncbi:MAG: DUF192 domain-containing protein [Gemmatimonadetes bacterium]|nr:DUF192 domain-containing protein [Gemmatimonadota bacterium]